MPSNALAVWTGDSAEKLDELIAAHARVEGTGPGRRYATEQLDHAIVLQIASHFQLFCRNLHSEGALALLRAAPVKYQPMLRLALTNRRALDIRNPWPDSIKQDFVRFDLDIWNEALEASTLTAGRKRRLEQLNTWRNAIAHQDFAFSENESKLLEGTSPTLPWARRWRSACNGLAGRFDAVVADHLRAVTGSKPW